MSFRPKRYTKRDYIVYAKQLKGVHPDQFRPKKKPR